MGSLNIEIVYDDDPWKAVTVLWVSRHRPLPAQVKELRRKLGKVRVVMLSGIIPNAEFVADIATKFGASYVVPVLPLPFIARLVELGEKQGFKVLFARMRVIAEVKNFREALKVVAEAPDKRVVTTYADGTAKVHEFVSFELVKEVKVVTEPW